MDTGCAVGGEERLPLTHPVEHESVYPAVVGADQVHHEVDLGRCRWSRCRD